jgi:hypothetical protein
VDYKRNIAGKNQHASGGGHGNGNRHFTSVDSKTALWARWGDGLKEKMATSFKEHTGKSYMAGISEKLKQLAASCEDPCEFDIDNALGQLPMQFHKFVLGALECSGREPEPQQQCKTESRGAKKQQKLESSLRDIRGGNKHKTKISETFSKMIEADGPSLLAKRTVRDLKSKAVSSIWAISNGKASTFRSVVEALLDDAMVEVCFRSAKSDERRMQAVEYIISSLKESFEELSTLRSTEANYARCGCPICIYLPLTFFVPKADAHDWRDHKQEACEFCCCE